MTMLELVKHLNFAGGSVYPALPVPGLLCGGAGSPPLAGPAPAACTAASAVIVSARNEEGVIGELLESLNRQNYPKELLDLYVVADNCRRHRRGDTAGRRVRVRALRPGTWARATPWTTSSADSKRRKDCYDSYFVFGAGQSGGRQFCRDEPHTLTRATMR